ncbi:MAG TPA: serine/threonine-protein kinase [Longimicrobium sp.]|nr:serine/threonine-protein kinase [Longimicrobium sp.]
MRDSFARALVGRTLAGRYELAEAIGAGGMSVVYRGMDRVLGRPIAVKVVALSADSEEMRANLRERFRREAGSAARIAHHPNIVQVYDYGTDPELDLDFIVMELLRGRDLKQALARGPVPPAEALRIVREAARGLSAGHREGIVHRDVKPANIFLVGDEERLEYVRVLDFGIAKPMEPDDDALTLTTAGQLPHSPGYASPEQTALDTAVAPTSDVYQLGLIAYELLAGERPYTEADRKRIRAGEAVPPARSDRWLAVPAPVRAVIERALSHDPAARYPDAGAFADALSGAEGTTVLRPAADDDDHTMLATFAPAPASASSADRADAASADFTAHAPSVADVAAMEAAATADDATGFAPGAPTVAPEPVSSGPVSLPPVPRSRRMTPAVWGIPLVLLVLAVAVWASRNRGGARADGGIAADTGAVAALHGTFLRLMGAASAAMDAPPDTAVAAAPPDTARADTARAQTPEAAAAAATQKAVLDLHSAWSVGDLDRMMEHYASRVDYYNVPRATRSFIRSKIRDTVRQYDRRIITIKRQATLMQGPNEARVLVDKDWDFTGRREHWYGSMRQELTMRLSDGEWKVVRERAVQIYNEKHEKP